jgi:hypothetical protein
MKASHMPITNRQQDAILPHMGLSSQGEAFDRAGGLSGRRFRYATNFSGFAAGCLRNTMPEKCLRTG